MRWKSQTMSNLRNNLGDNKGHIWLLTLAWWHRRWSCAEPGGPATGRVKGDKAVAGGQGPIRVCRHNWLQRVEHHAEDLQQHQQRHQHSVCPQVCLCHIVTESSLQFVFYNLELPVTVTTSWSQKTLTNLAVAVAQSAWVRNHQSGWKFWEIHKSQWSRCGELWLCL